MNIQAIRAYSEPVVRDTSSTIGVRKQEQRKNELVNDNSAQAKGTNSQLLTKRERDFFIKMFPDNSSQIENHVLFNRNGRLQTQSYNKGLIVDSRV